MAFEKKKIQPRRLKTKYTKRKYTKKKKQNSGSLVFKFIIYTLSFFVLSSFLWWLVIYTKYIKDLPSVNELENLEIAEASTIYDRNGKELYKIYKEKRTYVPFEDINKNMINALVAWEDKRFWENPGFDVIGLTRAVIYRLIGKSSGIQGTSTLTQQLIRNTIITNERTAERKIKEIYLAYKLTNGVSKEKIIELYLNKIEFWSNAFGIEQAAKTFFGVQAKDLNILQSSMLASLPKTPTGYSPYSHPDRLLGYLYTYEDEEQVDKLLSQKWIAENIDLVNQFKNVLNNLKAKRLSTSDKMLLCGINKEILKNPIPVDGEWCAIMEYSKMLNFLNSIQIAQENLTIEYQTGRKDFILWRMLEDGYITFDEYKKSLIDSFAYEFNTPKEKITAPHFVFYVKEYLEAKYGKEVIAQGWLEIYTTLDLDLQKKAEEIVEKQAAINESKFSAQNAGLISLDNKTGQILTMVGGRDYFDKDNKGNVNITTSSLQPGSTFKPFVYSMAMYKGEIWSKTPIYDLETEFPNYNPSNFDGKFMGKMNVSTALNNSRNIPAIKMFYLAGWERNIVNFMNTIWVDSLQNHGMYGAPLALGTGEMTPLELARAYSVFANLWVKKETIPILKIVDTKWNIVEEYLREDDEQVISAAQAYITNDILSDTSARPEFWNNYLSLKSRPVAAKTWTSTKQYEKWGKKTIYPRNLWTIWYTPQITTVVWAWNTDGKELNFKWNGLEWAWPIWKEFMEYAHKDLPVENWKKTSDVKTVNISSVSGLLPSPDTWNTSFMTQSLFINKPTSYDNSFKTVEVDALCNGIVTENTPEAAIKKVNLVQFSSLSPNNPNWEEPVQEWARSDEAKKLYGNITNMVTRIEPNECEREQGASSIVIKSTIENDSALVSWDNFVELAYRSNNNIIQLDVLFNDEKIDEIELTNKKEWVYRGSIFVPSSYIGKTGILSLRAVDNQYYSGQEMKKVTIIGKDIIPPVISVTNPSDLSIKLYQDEFFNLRANITDESSIRTINILIDSSTLKSWITDRKVVYPISWANLSLGDHMLQIKAIDNNFNETVVDINVEVIAK